jgi:hypothetical protein
VRHFNVGVATPNVSEYHAISIFQAHEQVAGRAGVGIDVGKVVDQCMRGAVDRLPFFEVQHIPVTPKAGIARPFVSGKCDESMILVKFEREIVQLRPELVGYLKVVALVSGRIEKCEIPCEGMKLACRVSADGFLGLPMQIAPLG